MSRRKPFTQAEATPQFHGVNSTLRDSAAIAMQFGCSAKTVQRLPRSGRLPRTKQADNTSPWTIDRRDLERLKRHLLLDDEN